MEISLKNANGHNQISYEQQFTLFANEIWTISVRDFPPNISFGILQVHAYAYNISLAYSQNMTYENSVNGTNVGLNIKEDNDLYLFNTGPFTNISIMIIVTAYDESGSSFVYILVVNKCRSTFGPKRYDICVNLLYSTIDTLNKLVSKNFEVINNNFIEHSKHAQIDCYITY